ncbi:MAG: DUF2339 domain-containing protein, partial [Candidatus Hydrogenedentes bacterium]|nr:DUF2339 domain-containing protein [Candidatus Hydrogenedentota bacterium]
MDANKRIEELEKQVEGLKHLVQDLLAERQAELPAPPSDPPAGTRARDKNRVQEVRQRVEDALRSGGDPAIESHIGSVWFSRLGVVALMTFFVLGAHTTYYSEQFGPVLKIVAGYLTAAAFIGFGFAVRKRQDLFAQAILGCGLAILYFVTYASFFVPRITIVEDQRWLGLALLMVCLAFMAGVAHWRRSQTVAGISLFLAYYTVAMSCTQDPTLESLTHALVTCTALALVTFIFHFLHRWLLFTWAALIATHLTYLFFFLREPPALDLPDQTYFWLSNGFLTVCYVLFSLTCIVDARKTGEYRKTVAPMAGVNSFVFLTLTWFAIRQHYQPQEWIFRLVIAGMLLAFALFAEMTGPRRNYLFQIFIAKTVIMLTLALQAYYSGEKLLVALAVECLGLGFSYRRSGLVIFKVLGLAL